jgi:hypothetical protein
VSEYTLNAEPTVGSAPPWAGVTPAPSEKEKMRDFVPVRTFFVCDERSEGYLARYFTGRPRGRRAQPPVGEGSAITSQTLDAQFLCHSEPFDFAQDRLRKESRPLPSLAVILQRDACT